MINPHECKVYTYCFVTQAKQGLSVQIIGTIDGFSPECEMTLNWLGNYDDLESFLFLMFKNAIIR